jgi:hypothetical protein
MTSPTFRAVKYINTYNGSTNPDNTNKIPDNTIETLTHHSSQSSRIILAAFSAIPYNEELKCADS